MHKIPHPENEYFSKIDVEKIRRIAKSRQEKLAMDERDKLKKLHHGHCSECGMELESIPFKGVTIHKCFSCNGVFLNAGTLENLCGDEVHVIESLLDLFKF
jgi:uncharacterized protein